MSDCGDVIYSRVVGSVDYYCNNFGREDGNRGLKVGFAWAVRTGTARWDEKWSEWWGEWGD